MGQVFFPVLLKIRLNLFFSAVYLKALNPCLDGAAVLYITYFRTKDSGFQQAHNGVMPHPKLSASVYGIGGVYMEYVRFMDAARLSAQKMRWDSPHLLIG
jgi:hypothetical protein